jgi:hypothetical protein
MVEQKIYISHTVVNHQRFGSEQKKTAKRQANSYYSDKRTATAKRREI